MDRNLTNRMDPLGENFIPLRHRELIHRLVEKFSHSDVIDENRLLSLYNSLVKVFQIEHLYQLQHIEDLYSPLDPDEEQQDVEELDVAAQETDLLFAQLSQVLKAAHYDRLDQEELNHAVTLGWNWGVRLNLDFTIFERLEVYARGYRLVKRNRRRLLNLFRLEEVEFPEFHRLVVAFKIRPRARMNPQMQANAVYLKSFKNIPENELEVLLPGSTIKLSLIDRGKILLPSLSGAALAAYKVTRGAMIVTIFTLSAFYNWLLFGLIVSFYLCRALFSYLRTKDKYQFGLTRNLYLKNLDNNIGVVYRLFREAEEQEVCETILVYCLLLDAEDGLNADELHDRATEVLFELTGQTLSFDVKDATRKLLRYGLAVECADHSWKVVPLDSATEKLMQLFPTL